MTSYRYKIKRSEADKNTGYSVVIISYKGKDYIGKAKYNFNDAEPNDWSSFLGCEYAEMRAERKLYKSILHDYIMQREGLLRIKTVIEQCKDCSADSPEAKRLNFEIKSLNKKIDECILLLRGVSEEHIKEHYEVRQRALKKIQDKRKQKGEIS